jgi:hypothetical protein
MRFSALAGLFLLLSLPAFASASPMIQARAAVPTEDGMLTTRAFFTSDVVAGLLANEGTDVQELTEAEAQALAAERGVALTASGDDYGRPWLVLKGAIGLPNLLAAYVEVFVARTWTAELGAGVGLLPTVFEGSIRWRPEATCWDCDGNNFFSIGFGIDPGVYRTEGGDDVGVMVTASVDLMYIHRFARHFGLMVGTRWGAGLVTEFGGSRDWRSLEPALKVNLLQVGLVF